MLMLKANHLQQSFGDRLIFRVESIQVHEHERVGIVGLNGAGKTTLLMILAKESEPEHGEVVHFGDAAVIPQLEGPAAPTGEKSASRWHVAGVDSGWMSGGERTRKKIAVAFEQEAHLLFADEPTSHLDLGGIEQLEDELNRYRGTVFLISHDRELMDAVCTKIIEIEDGEIREYNGNYSAYREQKAHRREREQFEYEQYVKEKRRLEAAAADKTERAAKMKKTPKRMGNSEARLHKMDAKGKKAKLDRAVKAIESRLEQLESKEKPKALEAVQFDMQAFSPVKGKFAVRFDRVSKTVGERTLFRDFSCTVKPGMKVALVGNNGAGKTTLLKMVAGAAEGITVAGSGKVGFFRQDLSTLDEGKSIYENVAEGSPYSETMIRTLLARLLFKREDVWKPVSVLSGGERMKVALAQRFLAGENILLLDEPTNYLDVFTQERLEEVLAAYPGTILLATHDRRLLNRTVDHVIVFEDETPVSFDGNYAAYLRAKRMRNNSSGGNELERLKLDNALAEVIGKLSLVVDSAEKETLEERYQILLEQRRNL
ncbi:MAG TPA: ABC-F type ribosomal protection protein [Bacillales bacterium]|nr:ABC-F type ribosomal protection protein [Bacillales bacterium]